MKDYLRIDGKVAIVTGRAVELAVELLWLWLPTA